jgi:Membrane bound O-acyl transferase family
MSTAILRPTAGHSREILAWAPLSVVPVIAWTLGSAHPAWLLMWALAFSVYAGLKWLTFVDRVPADETLSLRALGYLFLWPGMDAPTFFSRQRLVAPPTRAEWLFAVAKIAFGAMLLNLAIANLNSTPLAAAWAGLAGLTFVLHFGLFDLLSLSWRLAGVDARPLMRAPINAQSLGEFWSERWNLAFRDLAHVYVFRPLAPRLGVRGATLATFVVSGLIHDFVISIPAGGGYGFPTLYFVLQGCGVCFERTRLARRLGLGRGEIGWFYCLAMTMLPVGLLFHGPFIDRVVLPMFSLNPI